MKVLLGTLEEGKNIDTGAMRASIEKARKIVYGLCDKSHNFTMSIPVQRDQDSDFVLLQPLEYFDTVLNLIEKYAPQLEVVTIPREDLSAPQLLNKAAALMEERGKQYDQAGGERSMGKAVSAFNTVTGQAITEAEGWLLLQILKDVRLWQKKGYHQDSAEDCIAYSALKAEAKQKEALA